MLLDEDATLMSFFVNFTGEDEEEELINNLIRYVGGNGFGAQMTSEEGDLSNTTGDSLEDVSQTFQGFISYTFNPVLNVRINV